MKIKWLGHAAFLITTEKGTRILTDPYKTGNDLRYGDINEAADIVTVSHEHFDHNNVAAVKGKPQVVKDSTEIKGIKFKGTPTYHDDAAGKKRGKNTLFCIEADGLNLCHLGDLGHTLDSKQVAALGKVDILMVPVGGFFTIDAATATKVCDQIKPRVIIPMHFRNEKCQFPLAGVTEFTGGKSNVKQMDGSEVEFRAKELPKETQILVLKPAL